MSFSDAPCRTGQALHIPDLQMGAVVTATPPPPRLLTAILAWKSAVGTMGMGPPCFPNFRSKLSCTDTRETKRRKSQEEAPTPRTERPGLWQTHSAGGSSSPSRT